jgi:hypothetical protein
MKSINQIFKQNKALMDEHEVQELIEYCRDLEGQVMDTKQSKQFSFEKELTVLVRDVYNGINDIRRMEMEHERWGFEVPDYKQSVQNLYDNLIKFSKDYKFKLG